ncbi:exocyst complex component 3-like isoform X2 [Genypterus blacodes]|uniref:exocyst complex component 3-like isoform X2 n=1 Tax=Genypterus blacodes TaxID=154954 RepID=UPI003F76B6CD
MTEHSTGRPLQIPGPSSAEMAQMTSGDHPDTDRVSIQSNETKPNGTTKNTQGVKEFLRQSFRQVGEKSPFSPNNKGSKATRKVDSARNDLGSVHQQEPPSPTLTPSSPVANGNPSSPAARKKSLSSSLSDPTMMISDSLVKRGASIRRSLEFGSKRIKAKICRQGALTPFKDDLMVEKKEEGEEVCEEIEESYTLPEIPNTPLSVIQISQLIDKEELEEAHLNLLSLRQEVQQEIEQCGKDSPMNLAKKEKDLSLLYKDLRHKVMDIVRDPNSSPSRNKGLLVHVARIIQEEDKDAVGPHKKYHPGNWMEAWVEAVSEGVKAKLESIPLESREQNGSWLSVHLGLLGKAMVEDLETVKKELRCSYPPSFKVFSTYVKSYHGIVGQHLKELQQQVTELKEFYALLKWIIKDYQSDRIIGSPSLQPEIGECESTGLLLEDNFLDQLTEKYCCRMKEDIGSSLDKLIEMEIEDVWSERKLPEKGDDGFPSSKFPMDIRVKFDSNVKNSKQIDAELEGKVISSCLEELKLFPKSFDEKFRDHCSTAEELRAEYQITYINSFSDLQQHMEGYRDYCPEKVEDFRKEVKWLIDRRIKDLEEEFKEHVKPYLGRMLTRKWLTDDDDFKKLCSCIEKLSQHCALIRPPHAQELARQLHYHVVKEYVSQLMRNDYSCKNQKHQKAASKIHEQLGLRLPELFEEMNSTHEWLHPLGGELSDIIGRKNIMDIKDHVWSLVLHYPDISRKHLAAVLYFRGVKRGRERQQILETLGNLKRDVCDAGDRSRVLFGDMQVINRTNFLSNLPFSCLSP